MLLFTQPTLAFTRRPSRPPRPAPMMGLPRLRAGRGGRMETEETVRWRTARKVWITWEHQRRSIELARALDAELFVLLGQSSDIKNRWVRYFTLGLRTIRVLCSDRRELVFAQNPSMALALELCLLRRVLGFILVIDRHSNFKFDLTAGWKWGLFHWVSRFTVRHADLTIVTNKHLHGVVETWGGYSFVLQDKLPELPLARRVDLPGEKNIVFVSTFARDEPVSEVLRAAAMLPARFVVHITGNSKRFPRQEQLAALPENVRLTGFLPEADYQSLLMSADVIVVLTSQDHTLTCGAYEAVALGRPTVLSDTAAIRDYFRAGAVYTQPTAEGIREAIIEALLRHSILESEVAKLRGELSEAWECQFAELRRETLALLMAGR